MKFEAAIVVAAPINQVFAYGSRLENIRQWWPEHFEYLRLDGDVAAVGSRYVWRYHWGVLLIRGRSTITRSHGGRELDYEFDVPGFHGVVHQAYRVAEGGTEFKMAFEFVSSPLPILDLWIESHLHGELDRAVKVFKSVIEESITHLQWLRSGD